MESGCRPDIRGGLQVGGADAGADLTSTCRRKRVVKCDLVLSRFFRSFAETEIRRILGADGLRKWTGVGKEPPQSESSRSRKQVPSQQVNREKK